MSVEKRTYTCVKTGYKFDYHELMDIKMRLFELKFRKPPRKDRHEFFKMEKLKLYHKSNYLDCVVQDINYNRSGNGGTMIVQIL